MCAVFHEQPVLPVKWLCVIGLPSHVLNLGALVVLAQSISKLLWSLRVGERKASLQAFLSTVDASRDVPFIEGVLALLDKADVTEVAHLRMAKLEHF